MIFANTDKEITLIYNSEERTGKQILAYAQAEKITIRDIDLQNMSLTQTQWVDLASKLCIRVCDLVNTEDASFVQKFGAVEDLSDDDWLTVLVHNPSVLRAPIVMKGEKVVMMSNPQDMLQFIK